MSLPVPFGLILIELFRSSFRSLLEDLPSMLDTGLSSISINLLGPMRLAAAW